jgi:SPP1 gp7 family putative phage head morphogenesis protein
VPNPPKFTLPQRIQREYAAGIRQITGRVLTPQRKDQTLQQWLEELAARSKAQDIQDASATLASRMCQWSNAANMKTWRTAAAKSTNARKLYTLLQKELTGTATGARIATIIRENAAYISSLPLEAAQTLVDEVSKAQQNGARPGTVQKMLRTRFPELLRSRVQLISRTETSKAGAALTRARAEDLGIDCYIWRTSKDARVRSSHAHMDGVVIFWNDAPSPEALVSIASSLGHYHAGDATNDRCYSEPCLHIDDIAFPAKVYYGGTIHMMNKHQFKERFANSQLLAA